MKEEEFRALQARVVELESHASAQDMLITALMKVVMTNQDQARQLKSVLQEAEERFQAMMLASSVPDTSLALRRRYIELLVPPNFLDSSDA